LLVAASEYLPAIASSAIDESEVSATPSL